jgi:hypothetical protein
MLSALTKDTDLAENVKATQYVARLILVIVTACYEIELTKCFSLEERMDGKGRKITIGRTNELSGKDYG